jgi:hypothetical protein
LYDHVARHVIVQDAAGDPVLASWQRASVVVQLETVLRWHRAGFRLFWRRRSRRDQGQQADHPELHARRSL